MAGVLLAVAPLVVGACSGGSGGPGGSGGSPGSAALESRPATTVTTAAGLRAWCEADRRFQRALATPLPPDASRAQVKAQVDATLAALDDLHAHSPGGIRPAVATVRSAYRRMFAVLEAAGFDLDTPDEEARRWIDAPEVKAAERRFGAFERRACGGDPGEPPDRGE